MASENLEARQNPRDPYADPKYWPELQYLRMARFLSSREYDPDTRKYKSAKFPALAKFKGRRKLKSHEKAQIRRAYNIDQIVSVLRVPNDERPEHLQFYVYPGRRLPGYERRATRPGYPGFHGRGDESLIAAAEKLAELGLKDFKKFRRRKQLKPQERRVILRFEKRMRYANSLFFLNRKQQDVLAKQRRKRIFFPVPGLDAIKLKDFRADTQIILTRYGMIAREFYPDRKTVYIYKFVYVSRRGEGQFDALIFAGEKLKADGAIQLHVWTRHGPTINYVATATGLAAMLGDPDAFEEIARELGAAEARGIKSGGFASAFEAAEDEREEDIDEKASVVWVFGVVGLFQRRTYQPEFEFETLALRYGKATGQL